MSSMTQNRLKLDFSLNTNSERQQFISSYLEKPIFQKTPPTEDELEMMGNYILWGKNPETNLNATQDGSIEIETRNKTWSKNNKTESLDGLLETPTFAENSLRAINSTPIKVAKEKFSRSKTLAQCPPAMRSTFEELFARIDRIDMTICLWEIAHGKREKPPREVLFNKFSEAEIEEMREVASKWNQFTYLKKRHQLVELRREQFSLRDSFVVTIQPHIQRAFTFVENIPQIGADIEILPLGVPGDTQARIFLNRGELAPNQFDEKELRELSKFVWKKKQFAPNGNLRWIDFRDEEHLYQILQMYSDLKEHALWDSHEVLESQLSNLIKTFEFYVENADLSDLQREILQKKIDKERNQDIALDVNKKWGKSYTTNYISTIFTQRIIPRIAAAAKEHFKICELLFFEEEFKICSNCKKTLLRDVDNFTRKKLSADGLSPRCKKCEKAAREKAKLKNV